jgi:hypothetical protein
MAFQKSVLVPLNADDTFALITEPDRLRRWQVITARVDLRAGGDYRWTIIQRLTVDDALSRYVMDLAGQIITPAGRARGLFADPVQAGPDAGLLDRLIAFTGRSVS